LNVSVLEMKLFHIALLLSVVALVTVQASPIEKRQWFNNPNIGTIQTVKFDKDMEESA